MKKYFLICLAIFIVLLLFMVKVAFSAKEIHKIKADDGREEEIEIDKGELKDEVILKRWDGECYIKIGRKEKDTKMVIEGSVFKFDVELKKKPKSNVISFDIETKNLKFYYQPELTQEEIDEGCIRPENVIGSYAVYHATKRDNKYKCGKAFHIYRPKIIDNNGDWIWGELKVNGNSLMITIDQSWLDNAKYPILVDPDFGYKTEGSSAIDLPTYGVYECQFTMGATAGDGDKISACIESFTSNDKLLQCNIYDDSTGDAGSPITNGATPETTIPGDIAKGFLDCTYSSKPSLSANTVYHLAVHTNATTANHVYLYYDNGGVANQAARDTTAWGDLWPDPWSNDNTYSRQISIYCTYTEEGPPPVAPKVQSQILILE